MNNVEMADRIAAMFREARLASGKSQEYVAKSIGVSKKTIQNWESGTAYPNFRYALEWFDCIGVPMYPYLMALLYPAEIDGVKATNDMEEVRRLLDVYVEELDDHHARELLYILHGSHGSSPTGMLDIITTYLHLPLAMRIVLTENIIANYNMAQAIGMAYEDDHVLPKSDTLKRCVESAKQAVISGKESYTLTEAGQ